MSLPQAVGGCHPSVQNCKNLVDAKRSSADCILRLAGSILIEIETETVATRILLPPLLSLRQKVMEGPSAQASPPAPSVGPKHISNDGRSAATATTRNDDDVGLVVTRAKRAAASLWMLIHAEVSVLVPYDIFIFSAHLVPSFLSLLPFD